MGKYIRKFDTHSAYSAAESQLIRPNVSYCEDNNEVHYNPILPPETRVIAKVNIIDASKQVFIIGNPPTPYCWVEKIEIDDGTVIDSPTTGQTHIFSTAGEHTIYYTPKEDFIGYAAFGFYTQDNDYLKCSIIVPSNINAFSPNALTTCHISTLTCYATTPPTLDAQQNPLPGPFSNFTIYVPAESVDAYKTADRWSQYASKIQAIPTT